MSIEASITLEGVDMNDTEEPMDDTANVLETAIEGVLPEGSTVTIVSIGGVSVSRQRLRLLQENDSGIVVQFEVTASEDCSAATCDPSEAAALSIQIVRELTEALENSVESGELTVAVQSQAELNGDLTLSNATVSAVEVGEAEVTVTDAEEGQVPDASTDDSDRSASTKLGAALSIVAVLASMWMSRHFDFN